METPGKVSGALAACPIPGVIIKPITPHADARGWLAELFRHDEVPVEFHPVMGYVSMTLPGVARGPHEHREQADYFVFMGPSTFRIYLWDNREKSSAFGQAWRFEAGALFKAAVIVPPGVVHAYKNVGNVEGIVYNAPNKLFAGAGRKEAVDEIRHESDPASRFTLDP